VDRIPARRLIDDWQRVYGLDIEPELNGHEEIQLYESSPTSLRFFHPPGVAGTGRFYAQLEEFDWYYLPHRWEHQEAVSELRTSRRVLEIGCGEGAFLQQLGDNGIESEGIELNPSAVAIARQKGLPVRRADLHELSRETPQAFDAVCSFQVLEHVVDPREFLESAVRLTRPGGKLIVAVPNQASFLRDYWSLLNMPPHHMTQWTGRSLLALQEILPLRPTALKYESLAPYHVADYVASYVNRFRGHSRLASLVWNRWTGFACRQALRLGLRRYCRGHCLYAVFDVLEQAGSPC
jgi:2-polyprenyl-3-methyl-5-hydroxy-6-metoxy-1,4-benzoquinol methylase